MGTSRSFAELGGKMSQIGDNLVQARMASFRQAERDMKPIFNRQARAAGGADQRPRNARGRLSVQFKVSNDRAVSKLFINPTGPWGLRDNTDIGGKTAAHTILPRKVRRLRFFDDEGNAVFARVVHHGGSQRAPFWGRARQDAFDVIRRRIPQDVHDAIAAALRGSGFRSRR